MGTILFYYFTKNTIEMKKRIIVPALMLTFSSMLFLSCGNNTDTNTAMKSPAEATAENEDGEHNNKAKQVSMTEGSIAEAKSKTTENLLAAFKGETTASAKYAAYSKKAEQEGQHQIALLFRAASVSENVHAGNHKSVLEESGTPISTIIPQYTVKSTKENLEDAVKGETYEVNSMYPEFITVAGTAGNQLALISLNYAYKTEKKHKALYENALLALQNNNTKSLGTVFYVCPTCGNTYETTAPKRCGISMTGSEKFIKITSL